MPDIPAASLVVDFGNAGNETSLEVTVQSGDLILFDRPCITMDVTSATICYLAKASVASNWDHVGVVVENESSELYLLEANVNGVTCRPLIDRLRRSRSQKIAIRKLYSSNDKILNEVRENLWVFAQYSSNKRYNSSPKEMSFATLKSYANHGTNNQFYKRSETNYKISSIKSEMETLDESTVIFNLLKFRLSQLEKDLMATEKQLCISDNDDGSKHNEKYFCSQLVASIYSTNDIIHTTALRNRYFTHHSCTLLDC